MAGGVVWLQLSDNLHPQREDAEGVRISTKIFLAGLLEPE